MPIGRATVLLWAGLGLACSQPLNRKTMPDAADAPPDAPAPTDTDRGADFVSRPVDAPPDQAETTPVPLDGSSAEAADARTSDASLWADTQWAIDGPCSFNPPDLMSVLAASLASYEVHCSRTPETAPDPEGYIYFDRDGRVQGIQGRRIPADPEGWVESLAAYRWPCLAGQTIAYGCSA